ncbi:hypothetical protein F4810DRAFT_57017 [Camillea tinctor]|nr:hypothetical protein F4810DRAFT_57017 [Camillea tinctor]
MHAMSNTAHELTLRHAKSDAALPPKCPPTVGPCSIKSSAATGTRRRIWHENISSFGKEVSYSNDLTGTRERRSEDQCFGEPPYLMHYGTDDGCLGQDQDDSFPAILYGLQPSSIFLNHSFIIARNKLTEMEFWELLQIYQIRVDNREREQSRLDGNYDQADGYPKHDRSEIDTANAEGSTAPSRILACPFYRHNPTEYLSCLRYSSLSNIENVVQYLEDIHYQHPYCPTCHVLFITAGERDGHIRSRQCSPQAATWSIGITYREMQDIIDETNVRKVTTLRWFSIWGVVFLEE